MTRPACLVLALAAAAAGCGMPLANAPGPLPSIPDTLRVGVVEGGRTTVRRVTLDEYVKATTLSEFAPAAGDPAVVERMLEVQAVISRTYGIAHLSRHAKDGYDVCATTHCQLFQPGRLRTSRWAALADQAVRRTTGQVLWFNAAPATALFHADCGGHTSRADDVWGGTGAPYLAAAVDDGPAKRVHTEWRYEASSDALQRALNGDARTRIGTLTGIRIAERDSAGRAERVTLVAAQPRTVRGEEFRDVVSRVFGAQTIKSTWFEVRRERDGYVFEGRGFGHGVGLCQAGALARLTAGATVPSVLARYYPGVALATLSRAAAPRASAVTPSSRKQRY